MFVTHSVKGCSEERGHILRSLKWINQRKKSPPADSSLAQTAEAERTHALLWHIKLISLFNAHTLGSQCPTDRISFFIQLSSVASILHPDYPPPPPPCDNGTAPIHEQDDTPLVAPAAAAAPHGLRKRVRGGGERKWGGRRWCRRGKYRGALISFL